MEEPKRPIGTSQRKKLTRDDRITNNHIPPDDKVIPYSELEGTIIHYYLQEIRKSLSESAATHVHNFIKEVQSQYYSPTPGQIHGAPGEIQCVVPAGLSLGTIKKLITEHSSKIAELPEGEWRFQVHMSAQQGRRPAMEDRMVFLPFVNQLLDLSKDYPKDIIFAGIYDGHGGAKAAEYTAHQLHINILRNPNFRTEPIKAFIEGFVKTDELFCEIARNEKDRSGTTATAVTILNNTLIIANVGDSSAILCKRKEGNISAAKVTFDHKASNEEEKKRVKESGGLVVWFGGWRVNGTLAVSRSIGDESMAQQLIAEPFIFTHEIIDEDDFVIIATDGLWDVFSPEAACEFINKWRTERLEEMGRTDEDMTTVQWDDNASAALVEEAMKLNSKDNVTALVIFLKAKGSGPRNDTSEMTVNRGPLED